MRWYSLTVAIWLGSLATAFACIASYPVLPNMLQSKNLILAHVELIEPTDDVVQMSWGDDHGFILRLTTFNTLKGEHRDKWKVLLRSPRMPPFGSHDSDPVLFGIDNDPLGPSQFYRYKPVVTSEGNVLDEVVYQPCAGSWISTKWSLENYLRGPHQLPEQCELPWAKEDCVPSEPLKHPDEYVAAIKAILEQYP